MNIPGIKIKLKQDGAHNLEERATTDTRPLCHAFSRTGLFLGACLHGGGRPQVGEVTRLGGVTHLSI